MHATEFSKQLILQHTACTHIPTFSITSETLMRLKITFLKGFNFVQCSPSSYWFFQGLSPS